MYIPFNPNPKNQEVGDCTVRAICKLTERDWNHVFLDLAAKAYQMKDMPSSNAVWGRYLLATGTHVVTVVDGDYYDAWNSGKKVPLYYYSKD